MFLCVCVCLRTDIFISNRRKGKLKNAVQLKFSLIFNHYLHLLFPSTGFFHISTPPLPPDTNCPYLQRRIIFPTAHSFYRQQRMYHALQDRRFIVPINS